MSLRTWEQQALDSIKDDLASCEPALVARLALFTRLASGEDMPAREKSRPACGHGSGVLARNRGLPAARTGR